MENIFWIIIGIFSVILLAIYFDRTRSAVWGGFTAGIIIGLVIALFLVLIGSS